jgi:hypothetical protein
MHYLVATFPDEIPPEDRCADSEPVIPAFPMGDANHFIGVYSGGVSNYARTLDIPDADPDEALECLVKEYPGIPKLYLEDMLVATLTLASQKRLAGKIFRVFVTDTQAILHNVENEGELIPIWKGWSPAKYL